MDFQESCHVLNTWIALSQGMPIRLPSGDVYAFTRTKQYTRADIRAIEQQWQIRLPDDYCDFLMTVGAADCFIQRGSGFVFLPLEASAAYTAQIFDGLENPFPQLFLSVALVRRGEYAGFNLNRVAGAQFSVFIPDIYPEDWMNEASGWGNFSTWVTRLVQSAGATILPW